MSGANKDDPTVDEDAVHTRSNTECHVTKRKPLGHASRHFFLENGIKFRPLQKYTTSKLLQNSVLHAKTKETSLKK